MKDKKELKDLLERIDHRGYPAYKDTKGAYRFEKYVLDIEHVQGDPFASPSKVKITVSGKAAGLPAELYTVKCRRIAVQDYLLRQFGGQITKCSFAAKGSGKSGLMSVSRCGQEVLERSACQINPQSGEIIIRMEVGFPANGRTINAGELIKILFDYLPDAVNKTLLYANMDKAAVREAAELAEDQEFIREELKKRGLIAFIADGAVLPRASGVSDKPMRDAVAFCTPESMKTEMRLPNCGTVNGMGIAKGVTLIVGGGYHGKSTLLEALEKGIYNHVAGDGREYVITDASAMKIRAEDGRSIEKTDISMFIRNLPNRMDTRVFCTEDASGSTSQAANVIEAMEAKSTVLLIDEDTSATNFMIRDDLMQRVIKKEQEPIIPYIDRVDELYNQFGVSTILVAGSSGAYFQKADRVIQMRDYKAYDITAYAKEETEKYFAGIGYAGDGTVPEAAKLPQMPRKARACSGWRGERTKIKVNGLDSISINNDAIDMRCVEQLVDSEQLRLLGYMVKYLNERIFDGKTNLADAVERFWTDLEKEGLELLCGRSLPCNLAMPRKQELFACINRCRQRKI
ncbi:MAG: ABC-ATPase domain-containing protein [Roseburia sp.]|nr:ABC-ATPase domain-containing protein [Roseburia sp.]